MTNSPRAELTTGIWLGFWGLTLFVASFVFNLALAIYDPPAGVGRRIMGTSCMLLFIVMLVVSVLGAYRLSRALGHGVAMRIAYCALMLLPIGNFIFLWTLRERGLQRKAELPAATDQKPRAAERPASSLNELVAEAASQREAPARYGRFARGTLVTLVISGGLSGGLLAIAFLASDELYRFSAGILAIIPCVVTLAALIKTALEAFSVSPQGRTTPERAVEAYVGMVKQQRWPEAMSCLSWAAARGKAVIRAAIPEVDLAPATFSIRQPSDLAAYWEPLSGGRKLSGARSMSCQVLGVDHATATSAMVRVRFSVDLDLATAEIGGEAWKNAPPEIKAAMFSSGRNAVLGIHRVEKEICFAWPVYRSNGQWYLLQVGFL